MFPDEIEAFRQGLSALGYVEGRNLTIEYRWGEGKPERMLALAKELALPGWYRSMRLLASLVA